MVFPSEGKGSLGIPSQKEAKRGASFHPRGGRHAKSLSPLDLPIPKCPMATSLSLSSLLILCTSNLAQLVSPLGSSVPLTFHPHAFTNV
jgi:hypothetical protein